MWENPLESSRSALRPTTMPLSLTFLPDVQFEHQQLVLTGVSNKVAAECVQCDFIGLYSS